MTETKTYYREKVSTTETVKFDYLNPSFIEELVKAARKQRKKFEKDILKGLSVSKNGLSCHYVTAIDKDFNKFLSAITLWNASQDGYRKMVVSKSFNNTLEMYVIWSDAYIDSIGSFWDLFYSM